MKKMAPRHALAALFFVLLPALVLALSTSSSDEGMGPVSEIRKLDLRAKGLEIAPEEIFSPDRIGLASSTASSSSAPRGHSSPPTALS